MGDPNNFVTRIRIICCDPDNFVADPEHFGASLEPALLSSVADPKHCDFNSEPALFKQCGRGGARRSRPFLNF